MNLRRNILSSLLAVLAFVATNARTATWDIMPQYEKLNRYYGKIYAFYQNGKWGLVESGGKEILPASNDFITPLTNGYSLAGVKEGNRTLIQHIIDENGSVLTLTDKYYLSPEYPYVSDGKLAVANKNGRYGYIAYDGRPIIKCQFDYALPFKEGWAPVKFGNYTRYISVNYDRNPSRSMLPVDFHDGDMTAASCFSDGKAVVAYGNKDFALIGKNGHKIRKLKGKEAQELYDQFNASAPSYVGFSETSRYATISRDGKYGLKEGETVVVIPQFDSFPRQYNDGAIVAVSNGRYGVLKITDDNIEVAVSTDVLDADSHGAVAPVTISCNLPASMHVTQLLIDAGDGTYRNFSDRQTESNGLVSVEVTPLVETHADSCLIKGIIENSGLRLAEFEKTFFVSRPIRLKVSAPGPDNIRAASNEYATFSSRIFNESDRTVTVTAKWSTGKETDSIEIPPHSSRTVSGSIHVISAFSKYIGITLSTGESSGSTIHFEPFF